MNGFKDEMHTPVANEIEEVTDTDVIGLEPESGQDQEVATGTDGYESVPGYTLPAAGDFEASVRAAFEEDLPDIGVASFGMLPQTVHGTDDRVRISPASGYPWRAHASLLITARDGARYIGTGWFVGPRTLITAGHCVFIRNSGNPARDGWVQSVQVAPGRDAASYPYGTAWATGLRSVTGWTVNGNADYDYGAIILGSNLGSTTGWLGAANYSDATLLASTGNLSGYPGDKPSGTQWYHARRIHSVTARKVYYDIDTFGGQSGSAVYVLNNGARYAVAVHAYGGSVNSGTRINAEVLNNIVQWRA
ncbi:serine protease [Glutamicibacter sp. MNS18]|uniref:trypsin-like serine peptidase n=1 Tax=Glutamicibacter sp. MNS18 TaxID=2989817 RepID=UPI002236813B|nr:serine protease [Glutamicibacter sp. MNS18]MCW4464800.1 serine protease [Glutamicibacter sp. MNS18]